MTQFRRSAVTLAFLLAASFGSPLAAEPTTMIEARKVVDLIYPPGSYALTFRTAMLDFMAKQAGPDDAARMGVASKIIDEQAAKLGQVQEPIVRDQMAKVAAAKFSEAELLAIRSFLESPAGQAYSKHLPEITAVLETPEQAAAMMVATAELSEKLEAAER